MRSPSLPWLASSVTSNRSMGHAFRAATSRAPVPGEPVQATSARYDPCAAGCSSHDRETGAPTTRSSAHSTCWQSAFGHACTKTTPWVDRRCTVHLHRLDWSRLPLRTIDSVTRCVRQLRSRAPSNSLHDEYPIAPARLGLLVRM